MAHTDGDFPAGSHVRLRVPGLGILFARIAWAERGRVGGQFVTPVNPTRLGRALGFSRTQPDAAMLAPLTPA